MKSRKIYHFIFLLPTDTHLKSNHSPISSSTRQHLIDPDNMEWMQPHAQMKRILSTVLHHVFVTADTCCFQCFTRQLFILIWHHVDTQWKLIYTGFFATQVINSNLGIYMKNDLQKSYEQSLPYNERMVFHNCEDKDMNEKYIQLSVI